MDSRQLKIKLPKAKWRHKWASYLGLFVRFKVSGRSMRPILKNGDVVFSDRSSSFQLGDIVVAKHPFKASCIVIKQIQNISMEGYELGGVNQKESTDSRQLGLFKKEAVLGKVMAKG